MKINAAGLALLKASEGCRLSAYVDPGTGGRPYTIGYGHCGPEVYLGLTWTQEQCDNALEADLERIEAAVEAMLKVNTSSNEFSSLIVFSYNVGCHNLENSTLLRLLNQGSSPETVARQLLRWNRAAGVVLPGLTKRRRAEAALFLQP